MIVGKLNSTFKLDTTDCNTVFSYEVPSSSKFLGAVNLQKWVTDSDSLSVKILFQTLYGIAIFLKKPCQHKLLAFRNPKK